MSKFQYLVADASAFIKNVQLQNIAENCYTVPGVIKEIRSKRQKKGLLMLPYNLKVMQPEPDILAKVVTFAKKTGDFATMSMVDIHVVALTYELHKIHVGEEALRNKPKSAITVSGAKQPLVLEGTKLTKGFYIPKEFKTSDSVDLDEEVVEADDADNDGDSDDDDDNDGWITPSNVAQLKFDYSMDLLEELPSTVVCFTTDFAVQNVLKQIGLQIAALDGRVIRQFRTYLLRCYACFKTTSDVTKVFCPRCGNDTLKKVAVSLNEDGQQVIHVNSRRPLTAKYKNQPVAKFCGGKRATNPLLYEDQPLPQQRISRKARIKTNALAEDFIAGYSPFVMRDVDSRSAVLRGSSNIKQRMKNLDYDNKRRGYKK